LVDDGNLFVDICDGIHHRSLGYKYRSVDVRPVAGMLVDVNIFRFFTRREPAPSGFVWCST